MSKRREPLGLRKVPLEKKPDPAKIESTPKEATKPEIVQPDPKPAVEQKKPTTQAPAKKEVKAATTKSPKEAAPRAKGRPSTKKGKNLVKYSMDIHPELKRAVVKAAAIYDKEVHVMWNEIIFEWFSKETKKHPDWYNSIKIDKSEL